MYSNWHPLSVCMRWYIHSQICVLSLIHLGYSVLFCSTVYAIHVGISLLNDYFCGINVLTRYYIIGDYSHFNFLLDFIVCVAADYNLLTCLLFIYHNTILSIPYNLTLDIIKTYRRMCWKEPCSWTTRDIA